nr:DNA-binding WRKY [Tanacetum cinerariifolium]
MHDQGCKAKKTSSTAGRRVEQVPRVTYFGHHTCKISPHNDNTVPHHEPGAVLDFGGSKYQQSLKTNNSTTKKMGIKPSRKPKGHANSTPGSDQGGSSHSVMSNDLLADIDLFEIEDYLSALQFADDV